MENASKALIIAGAILLSILIISLGIMVYQNAKNTVGSTNLSKQEIEAFNSQWQNYESTTATASEVRTMYQAVIASNAAEKKSETSRYISVTGDAATVFAAATGEQTTPAYDTIKSMNVPVISNSNRYTIAVYYNSEGLVCLIKWGKTA